MRTWNRRRNSMLLLAAFRPKSRFAISCSCMPAEVHLTGSKLKHSLSSDRSCLIGWFQVAVSTTHTAASPSSQSLKFHQSMLIFQNHVMIFILICVVFARQPWAPFHIAAAESLNILRPSVYGIAFDFHTLLLFWFTTQYLLWQQSRDMSALTRAGNHFSCLCLLMAPVDTSLESA